MMKQVRQEQKSESRQIFLSFTNGNVSSVKKTNTFNTSSNSREKSVKATQLRMDETLRNIATEKCDHKIMVNEKTNCCPRGALSQVLLP